MGEAETRCTQKGVHAVANKVLAARRDGPLKVTQTQMWVNLVLAGVYRDKTDGKPNIYLLELWQQLKVDQWFTPLKKTGKKG